MIKQTTQRKPLTPRDQAFHRQCETAVIGGIYAAFGGQILQAPNGEYEKALRAVRRVAKAQADEMLRSAS